MGNLSHDEIKEIMQFKDNTDLFAYEASKSKRIIDWYNDKVNEITMLKAEASQLVLEFSSKNYKHKSMLDRIKSEDNLVTLQNKLNLINSKINYLEIEINNNIDSINTAISKYNYYTNR